MVICADMYSKDQKLRFVNIRKYKKWHLHSTTLIIIRFNICFLEINGLEKKHETCFNTCFNLGNCLLKYSAVPYS